MKNLLLILSLLFSVPAFATVADTSGGRLTATANGATTSYTFTFPVSVKADVRVSVTLAGVGQLAPNTVTINSDQINLPGGTVVFASAPANGAIVTIQRVQQLDQQLSLPPFNPFPAKAIERNLDSIMMKIQQVDRDRSDLAAKEAADISAAIAGGIPATNLLAPTATGQSTALTLPVWLSSPLNVKGCGAKGDGITDDYSAIQTCINLASSTPGGVLLVPPVATFYKIGTVLQMASNVTMYAYGAKFKLFDSGLFSETIRIFGVSNVTILGLEIDGNKGSMPATEFKAGININGNAAGTPVTNITLRDIYSHDNKGDGLSIGSCNGCALISNVFVENYLANANHRNALSITTCKNCRFFGFKGTNTGGTAPQMGVDIEPNYDTDVIQDISFHGCTFDNNTGAGAQVLLRTAPSAVQRNINFFGSTFNSNTGVGLSLANPKGVNFVSSEIALNNSFGIDFETKGDDISFVNTTIRRNAGHGAFFGSASGVISRTIFQGCRFLDNSTGSVGNQYGLYLGAGAGTLVGVSLIGNVFSNVETVAQKYGLVTSATVSQLRMIGNEFAANVTAPLLILDDPATRYAFGNQGLGSGGGAPCFFAPFDFPNVASGAASSTDVTVSGAVLGDFTFATLSVALPSGVSIHSVVTAANTVRVSLTNLSGGAYDAPNVNLIACLFKR